jgi:hypothetical protein
MSGSDTHRNDRDKWLVFALAAVVTAVLLTAIL